MTEFIPKIISYLNHLAGTIPVEVFMLVGGVIEEIIAPIPSPFVATLGGSISAANGTPIFYLVILAVIGAIGKTLASWIIYIVADKAEDVVLTRFGKLIGVSHKEIEKFGSKLDKTNNEVWVLIGLRALPIIPSAPISVLSGLVKINLKRYLLASLIGFSLKIFLFLYIGYTGLDTYQYFLSGFDSAEKVIRILILLLLVLVLGVMYYRRFRKSKDV